MRPSTSHAPHQALSQKLQKFPMFLSGLNPVQTVLQSLWKVLKSPSSHSSSLLQYLGYVVISLHIIVQKRHKSRVPRWYPGAAGQHLVRKSFAVLESKPHGLLLHYKPHSCLFTSPFSLLSLKPCGKNPLLQTAHPLPHCYSLLGQERMAAALEFKSLPCASSITPFPAPPSLDHIGCFWYLLPFSACHC